MAEIAGMINLWLDMATPLPKNYFFMKLVSVKLETEGLPLQKALNRIPVRFLSYHGLSVLSHDVIIIFKFKPQLMLSLFLSQREKCLLHFIISR